MSILKLLVLIATVYNFTLVLNAREPLSLEQTPLVERRTSSLPLVYSVKKLTSNVIHTHRTRSKITTKPPRAASTLYSPETPTLSPASSRSSDNGLPIYGSPITPTTPGRPFIRRKTSFSASSVRKTPGGAATIPPTHTRTPISNRPENSRHGMPPSPISSINERSTGGAGSLQKSKLRITIPTSPLPTRPAAPVIHGTPKRSPNSPGILISILRFLSGDNSGEIIHKTNSAPAALASQPLRQNSSQGSSKSLPKPPTRSKSLPDSTRRTSSIAGAAPLSSKPIAGAKHSRTSSSLTSSAHHSPIRSSSSPSPRAQRFSARSTSTPLKDSEVFESPSPDSRRFLKQSRSTPTAGALLSPIRLSSAPLWNAPRSPKRVTSTLPVIPLRSPTRANSTLSLKSSHFPRPTPSSHSKYSPPSIVIPSSSSATTPLSDASESRRSYSASEFETSPLSPRQYGYSGDVKSSIQSEDLTQLPKNPTPVYETFDTLDKPSTVPEIGSEGQKTADPQVVHNHLHFYPPLAYPPPVHPPPINHLHIHPSPSPVLPPSVYSPPIFKQQVYPQFQGVNCAHKNPFWVQVCMHLQVVRDHAKEMGKSNQNDLRSSIRMLANDPRWLKGPLMEEFQQRQYAGWPNNPAWQNNLGRQYDNRW